MKRKLSFPKESVRGLFQPDSVNEEKRTVDVVFSTGARVKRNTFFGLGTDYYEELDMKPSSVRLERFQNGAPVLRDHNPTLENQIGVIEKASVRKGEGTATVRFSERPDADAVFQDIKGGIVRNISIGYIKHSVREMPKEDKNDAEEIPVFRVMDWEPIELSFLPVQADSKAQVRNMDINNVYDCELIDERGETMALKEEKKTPTENKVVGNETRSEPQVDVDKIKADAIAQEKARVQEIRSAVKTAKLDDAMADDMISRDLSTNDARKEILEKLAKADAEAETRSQNVEVGEDVGFASTKRGIESAIMHRINPSEKLDDEARPFLHSRMMDTAKELLELRGTKTRGFTPNEIASRSLHSTSDYPEILANVANKTLRRAYEESPQTFGSIVRRVEEPDFKEIARVQLGDAPVLLPRAENGEYVYGTMSEAAEKYNLDEYGRAIGFSRKMLINDDLNAFARMPVLFGRAAANLESDIVWAVINANPNMGDGNALFSAAHGNLAGAGAVISDTTLGAAREAMRLQTSLDGNKLNIRPSNLAAPAALETTVDKQLAAITPNQASQVNPFGANGRTPLGAIIEPRLDDESSIAWYLFSDIMAVDLIELAYLVGERMPFIDSMIDFDTDGMKMKVRHTVAAKAIDWRGMYKNPGA